MSCDYVDNEPPMPTHSAVRDAFHKWLGTTSFIYFEPYVEALCRYCTIEKKAERLHWNYELPTDFTLRRWFIAKHNGREPKE